jgi:hypothetical protein
LPVYYTSYPYEKARKKIPLDELAEPAALIDLTKPRETAVLDPSLQKDLKKANRTATILHIALLCEPFIYILVALTLRKMGNFKGIGEHGESFLALIRWGWLLVSLAAVANVAFLRRSLLSAEKIAPSAADSKRICMLYTRAHFTLAAIATTPAILGLLFFAISGDTALLFLLSAVSVVVLMLIFPRYEILEQAVYKKAMQEETIAVSQPEPH